MISGFCDDFPRSCKQDIKTANLAEIVSLSNADFLVVVGMSSTANQPNPVKGDKNMKKKTCQAKRKGKLIEMQVGGNYWPF